MPKYTETQLDQFDLDSDGNRYNVTSVVDTYNTLTLTFGASFTLRLDYNDIEKFETALLNAKRFLQDQTIDQAGSSVSKSVDPATNDEGTSFNDPRTW